MSLQFFYGEEVLVAESKIGEGKYGSVWLCEFRGEKVAVKEFRLTEDCERQVN